MIEMIFSLMAESSTPLERFPWVGLMFIIESNSILSLLFNIEIDIYSPQVLLQRTTLQKHPLFIRM
jgi:hypothetical protein